jgi:hypothetical protein
MNDVDRDRLRLGPHRGSGIKHDLPDLPGIGPVGRALDGGPGASHGTIADQARDPRPRQAQTGWHIARQCLIETPGRICGQRHGQGIGGVDHGRRTGRR